MLLRCVQSATDYGPYVQNLASPLHTTTLVEACTQLLVDQWLYLRANVRTLLIAHV
jgi:V-type H+-transporting ATPase subunit d